MYTIDNYIKDTYSLTNSLVIKMSDVAITVNKGIYIVHGIKPSENKSQWKYYMNLAGEKHFTNNDVMITLLETGKQEYLSKELLENNQYTKFELNKYSSYYKELITNFPNDIDYIKGCINPVDIDKAIDARDGSIMAYSEQYIGYQELSIIRELEIKIQSMLARWHIKEYCITDELYLSSLIGIMYTIIPSMLLNLALERVNTNEVNSFHMEHFFRSRLNLWDNIQSLNNESKMWLYNNLNYLLKYQGRNETLDSIAYNVFEKNNLGLGTYTLYNTLPTLKDDPKLNEAVYNESESIFILEKLNNKYSTDVSDNSDVETILDMELYTDLDSDNSTPSTALETITKHVTNKLKSRTSIEQNTKILDISTVKLFKLYGNDPLITVLDNWLYNSCNGIYVAKKIFIDPNNKIKYFISPLEGLYIFYYMLIELLDAEDTPINTISYSNCINNNITKEYLSNNLFNLEYTEPIIDEILRYTTSEVSTIVDTKSFTSYLSSIKLLYSNIWVMDSNVNNSTISANIKHIVNRIYKSGTHIVNNDVPITMKDLLAKSSIHININDSYNKLNTITEIFKLFTGLEINEYTAINDNLKEMSILLNKLTSYTTQVIKNIDDNKVLYTPYTSITALHGRVGVITVTSASIVFPLENVGNRLICNGNDYIEDLSITSLSYQPVFYIDKLIGGIAIGHQPQYSDSIELSTVTEMYSEIMLPYTSFMGMGVKAIVESDGIEDIGSDIPSYTQLTLLEIEEDDEGVDVVIYNTEPTQEDGYFVTAQPNLIVEFED